MADKVHEWNGRPILHDEDAQHLESESALMEFRDHKPRKDAEGQAYEAYKSKHLTEAAAHHLSGMRAAQASGDHESAKKHRMLYELHLRALGHDPYDAVPDSVKTIINHPDYKSSYKFKNHGADTFLVQKNEEGEYELLAKAYGPNRHEHIVKLYRRMHPTTRAKLYQNLVLASKNGTAPKGALDRHLAACKEAMNKTERASALAELYERLEKTVRL